MIFYEGIFVIIMCISRWRKEVIQLPMFFAFEKKNPLRFDILDIVCVICLKGHMNKRVKFLKHKKYNSKNICIMKTLFV